MRHDTDRMEFLERMHRAIEEAREPIGFREIVIDLVLIISIAVVVFMILEQILLMVAHS